MAALQKVRNAGPLVVGALFLGLVGFIATDWKELWRYSPCPAITP